jgi:hypothetical protein
MRGVRILGLCLMAVCAVSALASSSAIAVEGPYFKIKVGAGPLEVLAEGKVEKFTLKQISAESRFYVPALRAAGPVVVCTGATGSGEICNFYEPAAPKNRREGRLQKGEIIYTGCSTPKQNCTIDGNGKNAGEIVTKNISGRLGFVTVGGKSIVATLLVSENAMPLAEIGLLDCDYPEGTFRLTGSAVVPVREAGELTGSFRVLPKVNAADEQELKEIEFPEWNEVAKKSEKQVNKGDELKFGAHPAAIEGEFKLNPVAIEVEIVT